ncbi:unnamed protein product [Didymodactylos carnosus]|uniref:Uncharacterized protein n=1 Tax=Didymodactylos carnosus TaxID=1234261 RepID=A0A814SI58_9BILA|nr:unnamed protein product [Didymodactylos carnosus]CAF3908835.1 unnamed protein product [Didymodactylos carnosus]
MLPKYDKITASSHHHHHHLLLDGDSLDPNSKSTHSIDAILGIKNGDQTLFNHHQQHYNNNHSNGDMKKRNHHNVYDDRWLVLSTNKFMQCSTLDVSNV